jgi:hypothetical protein
MAADATKGIHVIKNPIGSWKRGAAAAGTGGR